MGPVAILADVVRIAQLIHGQLNLAQSNQEKLKTLERIIRRVVASLQGLSILPDNKQFIKTLTDFQICLNETKQFIDEITKNSFLWNFIYAGSHEEKIDSFKSHIIELVPFLNLGLNAQLLMDRDRDRQDKAIDRQFFVTQRARILHDTDMLPKEKGVLKESILTQLVSFENTIANERRPISPTGEELYRLGTSVEKKGREKEAYDYYERSRQKGYVKAYTSLGFFMTKNNNKQQAEEYFQFAAEHGHPRAMFNLAQMFEKGEARIGCNNSLALMWYEKALAALSSDSSDRVRYQEKVNLLTEKVRPPQSGYQQYSNA